MKLLPCPNCNHQMDISLMVKGIKEEAIQELVEKARERLDEEEKRE